MREGGFFPYVVVVVVVVMSRVVVQACLHGRVAWMDGSHGKWKFLKGGKRERKKR